MKLNIPPTNHMIFSPNGKFFITAETAYKYDNYYQLILMTEFEIKFIGDDRNIDRLLSDNFNLLTKDAKFYLEPGRPNYIFDESVK